MQLEKNKYPFYPPYDDEISFYEGASVRVRERKFS